MISGAHDGISGWQAASTIGPAPTGDLVAKPSFARSTSFEQLTTLLAVLLLLAAMVAVGVTIGNAVDSGPAPAPPEVHVHEGLWA